MCWSIRLVSKVLVVVRCPKLSIKILIINSLLSQQSILFITIIFQKFLLQVCSFDQFVDSSLIKYTGARSQNGSSYKATDTSKHMNITSSSCIMETDLMKPTFSYDPWRSHWINDHCHQTCKYNISIHKRSLSQASRHDRCTGRTQGIFIKPVQIHLISEINSQELTLPNEPTLCLRRKWKATYIKGQSGYTNIKEVLTYDVHLIPFADLSGFQQDKPELH